MERRRHTSRLVSLVVVMDRLPRPPASANRLRGRPTTYADRLIMKALVLMSIRRLDTASALLAFLNQDDTGAVAAPLGRTGPLSLSLHVGTPPSRAAGELTRDDGVRGRHVVALWQPWTIHGRAVAINRTALWPPALACGTHPSASRELCRLRRSIRQPAGASRAGMAGGMAGSGTEP